MYEERILKAKLRVLNELGATRAIRFAAIEWSTYRQHTSGDSVAIIKNNGTFKCDSPREIR